MTLSFVLGVHTLSFFFHSDHLSIICQSIDIFFLSSLLYTVRCCFEFPNALFLCLLVFVVCDVRVVVVIVVVVQRGVTESFSILVRDYLFQPLLPW